MKCPLVCSQHGCRSECLHEECMLYNTENNSCLIRHALQTYIVSNTIITQPIKQKEAPDISLEDFAKTLKWFS